MMDRIAHSTVGGRPRHSKGSTEERGAYERERTTCRRATERTGTVHGRRDGPGLTREDAQAIVAAASKGEIKNVRIQY